MATAEELLEAPVPGAKNPKEIKNPTQEQLAEAYNQMEKDIGNLIQKISDLDNAVSLILFVIPKREHELVLVAFDKVPDDRRCCRMVGGILSERTVKEVRPQVKENLEKICGSIGNHKAELDRKGKLRKLFIQKYNWDPKQGQPNAGAGKQRQQQQQQSGVLV
eukprot:g2547.t1